MSDGGGPERDQHGSEPEGGEPDGGAAWEWPTGDAGARDVLGPPVPAAGKRGGLRAAAIGGAAVLVMAAAGAAAYAVTWLSGGGTQPEQVLPANSAAFLKVDLDPSAKEKVDVYRLLRKFPSAGKQATDGKSLKQVVVESLLESDPNAPVRWSDIKPWLGDRAAIAAVPGVPADSTARSSVVGPVIAIQVTNQDKAAQALRKIESTDPGDDLGWYFKDGYVVIAATDRTAARLAHAHGKTLADQSTFNSDMKGLGGSQLAAGWVDVGRVARLAANSVRAMGDSGFASWDTVTSFHGRVALGVHAESDAVEVTGRTYGGAATSIGTTGTAVTAAKMPADSVGVFSVAGLGPQLEKTWTQVAKQAPELRQMGTQFGLALPDDLVAALGHETTLAVGPGVFGDKIDVAVRSRGDAATIVPALHKVADAITRNGGTPAYVLRAPDGGVLAGDSSYGRIVAANGKLGDEARFRNAVPDYRSASVVLYVDNAAIVRAVAAMDRHKEPDLQPLDATGFTAEQHGSVGTFRLRETFR